VCKEKCNNDRKGDPSAYGVRDDDLPTRSKGEVLQPGFAQ